MIKSIEVIEFMNDVAEFKGFNIKRHYIIFDSYIYSVGRNAFDTLEQAIKYILQELKGM